MYSIYVLIFVGLVAAEMDPEECRRMAHPKAMHCCKSLTRDPEHFGDVKECFKGKKHGPPPPPPNCDIDICIAKKKGYADDDGKLDKDAFEKIIEEDMQKFGHTEALKFIKRDCIQGDLEGYGAPEACELSKLRNCVQTGLIMTCTEFDDSNPQCVRMKGQVDECVPILDVQF